MYGLTHNGKKLNDVLAFGDARAGRGTDDRGQAKSVGMVKIRLAPTTI